MPEVQAHRRLVKSPPELWAELSDVEGLARHLGEFGEIRITRTDPETTVAWECEHARGTVAIEASGWGTKVTLTAETVAPEREAAAEPEREPAADADPAPVATPDPEPVATPYPAPAAMPDPEPEPEPSVSVPAQPSSPAPTPVAV